ncbi:DNA-dependent protein kinase catalytic subunit-like [Prorops nasuta]|uniref:DNA-dependent protein kinase catalytic subunit-like n=1 Tax=Prorops nasuta TaxID=863751 RepID=UPI0034CE3E96
MESVQDFMDIFIRYVQAKNYEALFVHLRNRFNYFQNIPSNESALVLASLFDKDHGLLHFLKTEVSRMSTMRYIESCMKEGFLLIEFVMEQLTSDFQPYIMKTKDLCEYTLITKCSANTIKAATNTFIKLLTLFNEYDLNLDETVIKFFSLLYRIELKGRSFMFSVIGTIAKYYPETVSLSEKINMLYKYLQQDFTTQYKRGAHSVELEIYLQVYNNILKHFPPPHGSEDVHCIILYGWIKKLSPIDQYGRNKTNMREAIRLLVNHMKLFKTFIYDDYQFWLKLFSDLTKENTENGETGRHALKYFYTLISDALVTSDSDKNKTIFNDLKSILQQQLTASDTNTDLLGVAIYGYSELAAANNKFESVESTKDMYNTLSRLAIDISNRHDTNQDLFKNISNYQEALSKIILCLPDLSNTEINVLIFFSTFIIKKFPDLIYKNQENTISSLINTFVNIGSYKQSLLQELLYHTVHDGIIWCCSHTLLIDAELEQETKNLKTLPITYKNYLPLWKKLLNSARYNSFKKTLVVHLIRKQMVQTCASLINKLNLKIKEKENNISSDIELSLTAENEADFRIFINLVDLYVELFKQEDLGLLSMQVDSDELLYEVIRLSYEHPLISGFYKLAREILKYSFMEQLNKNCIAKLNIARKYLLDTIDLIPKFTLELQITCLNLILEVPVIFIKDIIAHVQSVMKISFTLGLSNLEIAFRALTALEIWIGRMTKNDIRDLIEEILPYLDKFLLSKESSVEMLQELVSNKRKGTKQVTLIDIEETLENFQSKVLIFLGSLDSDVVSDFAYKASLKTGATWDKKNLLQYDLSMKSDERKIRIFFDNMLDRLITLAQNSGDRRTKVAACEVLHSITTLVIGKSMQTMLQKQSYLPLYKNLCPTILILSCDSDDIVKKLFRPLAIQLMHWFSSRFMPDFEMVKLIVDTLFEALSDESNSRLREFSGHCLAEFVAWAIKQSAEDEVSEIKHIRAVMQKLTYYALHPSLSKRIAAAIAFNHLYVVLRENEDLISIYWLELTYCFVKSTNNCDDSAINRAIVHLERVLVAKIILLNEADGKRRIPGEFKGNLVTDAKDWLLTQCCSLDENCRRKSMELYGKICTCISDGDLMDSSEISSTKIYGLEELNRIVINDLNTNMDGDSTNNMKILLKSLDCYNWLVKKQGVIIGSLLRTPNNRQDIIVNSLQNFAYKVISETENIGIFSKEEEERRILRCKMIVALCEFLELCFNSNEMDLFKSLHDKRMFQLITKCVMCPQALGFSSSNFSLLEKLILYLKSLLKAFLQPEHDLLLKDFQTSLSEYIEKHPLYYNETKIIARMSNYQFYEQKQYIRGLILLTDYNILSTFNAGQSILSNIEETIKNIFQLLFNAQNDQLICSKYKASVTEYLQILMKLFLVDYKDSTTDCLIEFIKKKSIVLDVNDKTVTSGEYFFNMFKEPVMLYLLRNIKKTSEALLDLLETDPSFTFSIYEMIFLFIQRNRKILKDDIEFLVDNLIVNFSRIERAVNYVNSRKEKLINIYSVAVRLKRDPINAFHGEDFRNWIFNQIIENQDIEYKTMILNHFLIFIIDSNCTSENKPELSAILKGLKNESLVEKMNNQNLVDSVDAIKMTNCFRILMKLLVCCNSVLVFECVVFFAAGAIKFLFHENTNKSLENYYKAISNEQFSRSLEIAFKLFMNMDSSKNDRFDVLHKFLLPMFEFGKQNVLEKFFEDHIKTINEILAQSLSGSNIDIRRSVISKIGCYNLLSVMFAKIDLDKIDDVNSVITRNAMMEKVEKGDEFIQALLSNLLSVRALKTLDSENKEIMRLLHCAAYNCSISLVSVKKTEIYYRIVFAENRKKQQFIWKNIVDCTKRYNLQQTASENLKRQNKLIHIRQTTETSVLNGNSRFFNSYIRKYNILTSTLVEDMNAYDLNDKTVFSAPISHSESNDRSSNPQSMNLLFECDQLNDHECMAPIIGILQHIIHNKISILPNEKSNAEMPEWMKHIHNSMVIEENKNNNIRLFMLKMILNCEAIFKPYAKFFLLRIMKNIKDYLTLNPLNYIITDALIMLAEWHPLAAPKENDEKEMAQKLFETLLEKAFLSRDDSRKGKRIQTYNNCIIEMLMEAWKSCLKLPENINKLKKIPNHYIDIILMSLINQMEQQIFEREDILTHLKKTISDWSDAKEERCIIKAFESLGLILKYLETRVDDVSDEKNCILDIINKTINENQFTLKELTVKFIYAVSKYYLPIAENFLGYLAQIIGQIVDPSIKEICLKIFLLILPKLSEPEILPFLEDSKFSIVLENKQLMCEEVALQIIRNLITILTPINILTYMNLILPYKNNHYTEFRELVYEIFMDLFRKYINWPNNDDQYVKKLLSICRKVLQEGILDPAEKLQKKVLDFFTSETNLRERSTDRLIDILKVYSPDIEVTFLPLLPLAILDLTSKSSDYESNMFEKLLECDYKNYEISTSWRTMNVRSRAPLFAPSLASEMNQVFDKSISSLHTLSSYFEDNIARTPPPVFGKIRATQDLEFDPTYNEDMPAENGFHSTEDGTVNDDFKIPQPFYSIRSKRPMKNFVGIDQFIRNNMLNRIKGRKQIIKEEVAKQRNIVRLYRKYRTGDFPDIAITHSTLLEPLKELIKRDQIICKHFSVSIFSTLIDIMTDKETITDLLKNILQNCHGNGIFIDVILEVIYQNSKIDYSTDVIARITKDNNNLINIGILLLEKTLINSVKDDEPPAKRKHTEREATSFNSEWLHLADLYKSLKNIDVVLSVFGNKISQGAIRKATLAQTNNLWMSAKDEYLNAIETESRAIQDHCLQGLFECYSRLSSWEQIDEKVYQELDNDYNNIWNENSRNWLFPWMFEANLHRIFENNRKEAFLEALNSWLDNERKLDILKRVYGKDMAMFFMCNNLNANQVRIFLVNGLEGVKDQWIKLSPLATQLRVKKFQELKEFSSINTCINTIEILTRDEDLSSYQNALKRWLEAEKSSQDNLPLWDKCISFRVHFLSELIRSTNATEVKEFLEIVRSKSIMQIIDYALDLKNTEIAWSHIVIAKNYDIHKGCLKDRFKYNEARTKFLAGQIQSDTGDKMTLYRSAWKRFHAILQNNEVDASLGVPVRQQIHLVALALARLSLDSEELANDLREAPEISKYFNTEDISGSNLVKCLNNYAYENLKTSCSIADEKNMKNSYLELLKYCYKSLNSQESTEKYLELSKDFVYSTLKAMQYNSLDAAHYFPCLLKQEYMVNDETKTIFITECKNIPTWMFLSWQAQLLSHLGTELSSLVAPIIQRLVDTYPDAIIYTLRVTAETNIEFFNSLEVLKIRQLIDTRQDIEHLINAMQFVVQPELYLTHYLTQLLKDLNANKIGAIDSMINHIYPQNKFNSKGRSPKPGSIYEMIKAHKNEIEDLKKKEHSKREIIPAIYGIIGVLKRKLAKRKVNASLKSYSPWLHEYSGGSLEIPGQYSGDKKPLPQYHARIMKFEPAVKVMASLRRPIQIAIVGSDAKSYNFLVKFGEDLRLDQRLQQLFGIINKILENNLQCRERHLSVATYQVIPLSRSLGLIQWVQDTKSLQELINFSLSDGEKRRSEEAVVKYSQWIEKAAPKDLLSTQYKKAAQEYNSSQVAAKMNELRSSIKWDTLRRTFMEISPSIESFLSMRQNFITTYATMCVAHWILGIGDRNLSNTLVIVDTGRSLGIDFGLAFGGGIDQSIPELVPFRLTSQILGLLQPFSEKELFAAIMTHVLRALRLECGPILSCLDIFVHEPLNWTENINKTLKENEEGIECSNGKVQWVPKKKILIVKEKLNGIKPSTIMLQQFKGCHSDQYFEKYSKIITGEDESTKLRFKMRDTNLSVEEQVECLLDETTDLNLLGRMYVGWRPWI